ncbi:MAG: type II toxin-antitoxin system PemK/MazF family toxin [Panacagrimonas sp.]
MSFERGEIVVVPFPFADRTASKRRPALVLSSKRWFNDPSGHSVMAMITSQREGKSAWPLDMPIQHPATTGLTVPSLVRFKLFTLDHRMVMRKLGHLSGGDDSALDRILHKWLFQ